MKEGVPPKMEEYTWKGRGGYCLWWGHPHRYIYIYFRKSDAWNSIITTQHHEKVIIPGEYHRP